MLEFASLGVPRVDAGRVPRRHPPHPPRPCRHRRSRDRAGQRQPAPRRGRRRARRPFARPRLLVRRSVRRGSTRTGRRCSEPIARGAQRGDVRRARRQARGRAAARSQPRRPARARRRGGRDGVARLREGTPPGRAARPVPLPRDDHQHGAEPALGRRHGGSDPELQPRRGGGERHRRPEPDRGPVLLGDLHRPGRAGGDDPAVPRRGARLPAERVRERLHGRARATSA